MSRAAKYLNHVSELGPRDAAAELAAVYRDENGWLDTFAESLDQYRAGQSLARTLAVWDINQSQAARLFGVSRQAVSKWLDRGAPADRAESIADLAAATDLLLRYLKRDRIPAVVRRPVEVLQDRSLLDLVEGRETRMLLETCRDMFRFDRAQH